jgi:tripartite-type tricarboxylate transporter receptor subunit TctC
MRRRDRCALPIGCAMCNAWRSIIRTSLGMTHFDYIRLFIIAAAGCAFAPAAAAQSYPSKPIRMVVPFAPGGGTDVIARYVATGMTESLGRQVVVDNRAGANGIVGTDIVAHSAPDGYTLLFVSSPHSVNPSLYPKLPYDTLRDFAPVSMVALSPYVLVVNPKLPARNVKELIALAKAQPDEITYGSGGSGSSAQLAAELFNQMAGVKLREIPYKGAGPALLATLAGECSVVFGNALTVKPHIESGRVRALGIASEKRSPSAPDIPTIAESGVPGYHADAVLGALVPARTPRAIVERLNAEIHRTMRKAEAVEAMRKVGVEIALSTPEEFGRTIESEMRRWGKVVKTLKLKVQ